MQLLAVGQHLVARIDHRLQRHAAAPRPASSAAASSAARSGTGRLVGRRLLALAIGHDVGGQGHGAVQRPFQARQGAADLGIVQRRQAVRGDLGAGQHVRPGNIDSDPDCRRHRRHANKPVFTPCGSVINA